MNRQELIAKYTKLVMKRLYNEDVQVFFQDMYDGPKALQREKGLPPYKMVKEWDKTKDNITFHKEIFRNDDLYPPIDDIWKTIVHEVTHHEIGVYSAYMGGQIRHSADFKSALSRNLKKVKDLRKEFKKKLEAIDS